MSAFTDAELRYLRAERRLARLATVGKDGMPHIAPVGWSYNDQVGTGRSARLADPRQYTIARNLADLEAIRRRIGADRLVLVGHSWGAQVAVGYLAAHPDRVARVVFSSPGALAPATDDGSDAGVRTRLSTSRQLGQYLLVARPRVLLAWTLLQVNPLAAHAFAGDPEMDARNDRVCNAGRAGAHCRDAGPGPALHGLGFYAFQFPQSAAARPWADPRPQLARLTTPALVIKGSCDYLSWATGVDYRQALPNAQLVYLHRAGHNAYQDQPAAFLSSAPSWPAGPCPSLRGPGAASRPTTRAHRPSGRLPRRVPGRPLKEASMVQQQAIVVGAGIRGRAAAGALRRVGWAVQVLEQAERLGPVDAGLTLWPPAVLALDALGVGPAVRDRARPLGRTSIRTASGRWLSRTDTSRYPARLGAPLVAVHRADLHRVLLAAAGPELVRTGTQVTALDQDKDGVRVTWEGGEAAADLLVAADGLDSTLRRAWFGQAARPVFTGRTAWRAVLDHATGGGQAEEATESWGRGQRFGIVPLAAGRVYWFAAADAPEHQRTPTGERAELLARFAGWHPPIPELIAATPPSAVLRHDLYELRPDLPTYARGRALLLGDAAHAMTPDLGQGAGQALEDAVVLGAAVATTGQLAAALARYDAERRPRTQAVARRSRRTGRLAQASGPLTSRLRDLAVRATPAGVNDRLLPYSGGGPRRTPPRPSGSSRWLSATRPARPGTLPARRWEGPEPTLPVRTEGGTAHE